MTTLPSAPSRPLINSITPIRRILTADRSSIVECHTRPGATELPADEPAAILAVAEYDQALAALDELGTLQNELKIRHQRQHDAEALAGEYLLQRDDARAELAALKAHPAADATDEQCLEFASALEVQRAIRIVAERVRTEVHVLPGGLTLPGCGTLPSKRQPADTPAHCQCEHCQGGVIHASDCAVHNEPAYPSAACDCLVTSAAPAQAPQPLACEWLDVVTADYHSDDLVWLYDQGAGVIDGPRPFNSSYDPDVYTHWAPCEAPSTKGIDVPAHPQAGELP